MKSVNGWAGVVLGALGVAGCASILGIGEVPDPGDGGGVSDSAASETAPDTGLPCPKTTPIDLSAYPWKSPNKAGIGNCTKGELDALVIYAGTHTLEKGADWKNQVVNVACRDCVFGEENDALWRPVMLDGVGDVARYYVGGCITIMTDEACGKAYQGLFDCRIEACSDCSGTSEMLKTCLNEAEKGACKAAFDARETKCGARLGTAQAACELANDVVWEGSAIQQCVGADGG